MADKEKEAVKEAEKAQQISTRRLNIYRLKYYAKFDKWKEFQQFTEKCNKKDKKQLGGKFIPWDVVADICVQNDNKKLGAQYITRMGQDNLGDICNFLIQIECFDEAVEVANKFKSVEML